MVSIHQSFDLWIFTFYKPGYITTIKLPLRRTLVRSFRYST